MKHSILALFMALALSGCLSSLTTDDYNRPVQVGMTEKQLTDSIGKPEVITKRPDGSQVWVYSFGLGVDAKQAIYIMKDGKVAEIPSTSTNTR
jgi:hypothetical protein